MNHHDNTSNWTKEQLEEELDRVKDLAAGDPDGEQYDAKIAEMEQTINRLPPDMGRPQTPAIPDRPIFIRDKKKGGYRVLQGDDKVAYLRAEAARKNERKRLLKQRRKKEKRARRR